MKKVEVSAPRLLGIGADFVGAWRLEPPLRKLLSGEAFFYITMKTKIEEKLINIFMYHSQPERTQGYRAYIANGAYNSTMISN